MFDSVLPHSFRSATRSQAPLSLDELLEMACQEPVILRLTDHKDFVLSAVDDFELEVELLKNHQGFMAYYEKCLCS
jgi:hypothetical protein